MPEVNQNSTLYDQDYYLWLETTVKLLQERRFEDLDLDNVIEEIEGLAKVDQRGLRNRYGSNVTVLFGLIFRPERTESYKIRMDQI